MEGNELRSADTDAEETGADHPAYGCGYAYGYAYAYGAGIRMRPGPEHGPGPGHGRGRSVFSQFLHYSCEYQRKRSCLAALALLAPAVLAET